jgi:carbonic anhydrase
MAPAASAVWRYTGSLTTPPCTEGVHWFVLATPVELSHGQIEILKSAELEAAPDGIGNNRPVQPLNGRRVILDFSRGFGQNTR